MTVHSLPSPVRTTCPYCGVGCGVVATPTASQDVLIAGDADHPANHGKLCVKGSALGSTLGLEGRLLHPTIHGQRSTWNQAINFVAKGLQDTLDRHGPDAVAFYLSGQLLTEDYYVANKFAKGFLGTPHVDTNSRLCMASSVAGHRRAFGADTVPNTYSDLDEADLIILVGSNAAWCHPVLFQRMQAAREKRGAKIINIDPRRTATSEGSDLQLSVKPGMDSVLFSWLLVSLEQHSALAQAYVSNHTSGLDAAMVSARSIAPDVETVAARTGLAKTDIERFVSLFLENEKTVTCYSQGVNQSAQGSDKVNAILNCHLVTGRIGKPGCGPLSLTGQPNAMGGREVGGLANMLAAHMGYSPPEIDRVQRFWQAPNMARREGLKAVQMFEAIEQGRIKALWVMHTNPAVTLPRADAMQAAMKKLDLLVVSEAMAETDTSLAGAHVMLPATAWGEKNGTVTNSERRISRQRSFLAPPGECKPDWQHIALVAERMGFETGFDYPDEASIFREHAALSAYENTGTRDFDIGAVANLSRQAFEVMEPFQWPWPQNGTQGERFFADGGFYTPDRRGRFVAVADPALAVRTDERYPFILNTGRVRDHWHTMTRTAKAAQLSQHIAEPMLAIHPDDADAKGLSAGHYVKVESRHAAVTFRVTLDSGLPRGSVFAPFHWNSMTSGLARVDAVVHAETDPFSGQPESKATPVNLTPVVMLSEGLLLSRKRLSVPAWLQHTRLTVPGGEAILFASTQAPHQLQAVLVNVLGTSDQRMMLSDAAFEDYRSVTFAGEQLDTALFIGRQRDPVALDWLIESFGKDKLNHADRKAILAGRPPAGRVDLGPLVCSCFAVRRETIAQAIRAGASDVSTVGEQLKAGTNCGSCRPEISRLIADMS
ncbi:MAG: molybdopterin-dependent oxidoreductase [Beijerinckiaceae bacterium]